MVTTVSIYLTHRQIETNGIGANCYPLKWSDLFLGNSEYYDKFYSYSQNIMKIISAKSKPWFLFIYTHL